MLLLEDLNDLAAMVQTSGAVQYPIPGVGLVPAGGRRVPAAAEWCDSIGQTPDDGSSSFEKVGPS